MCQAKILLHREGGREVLMEDVTHLRVDGDVIWLSRLFESPTEVRAAILEADFLEHTVSLVPIDNRDEAHP
jgi:predicted RNA-binding protein